MSIIVIAILPAPIKISFESCLQSYMNDFLSHTIGGKHFWAIWQTRDIINAIFQTHKYNLHCTSMHSYPCAGPRDFLLLAMLHGEKDVIKIHRSISPTGNITFNLAVIKVVK